MLTTTNYSYDKLNKLCSVVRNSIQAEHLRGIIRDSALSKSITTNNSVKTNDDMFVTVSEGSLYNVLYDKDTKVMYIKSYRGVFEMLVNADGTPRLYKGE